MKFSENLIKLRRQKGLSQEELGNEVRVTRQTVSKWELGETTPEMDKLIELASLFEISIDELVGNNKYRNKLKKYIKSEYVYKSKSSLNGIPLVHINIGKGKRTAKGLIAIGNKAIGLISIGGLSLGLFSVGGIGVGIISLAMISLGLLLAIGGIAIGSIAVGCFALGILAIGGLSIGIYSLGGIAIARDIACGGYANAHVAIGQYVSGTKEILITENTMNFGGEIRQVILKEFPNIWKVIVWFYASII